MTTEEALSFLRDHQPMPDDKMLSEELCQDYDEIRRYFIVSPDERCIPLFLNSFGEGDGFGVYQLVGDVLTQYPAEKVVPHLETALQHPKRSIRYWAAEISASFPSEHLVRSLSTLFDEDDEDLIAAAAIALGQINSHEAELALRLALVKFPSEHLRTVIREQLSK